MANPGEISFQDNFETGDATGWSGGLTDTGSYADVVHYSTLAGISGMPMPYSGAYCARWLVGSSTNDSIFTEADIDINATITNWVKFNVWIDKDFKTNTTADDTVVLFEATATAEEQVAFGIRYVDSTNKLNWAVGTHATAAVPDVIGPEVTLGVWHTIELKIHIVTASAAGDVNVFITEDGQEPSETADITETGIQHTSATTEGLFGVQDPLTTTNGIILMDGFQFSGLAADSGVRIYPTKNRFSTVRQFIRSGLVRTDGSFHAFVGPGTVSNLTWSTGGTVDGLLAVYDTDTAQNYTGNRKAALQQAVASQTISLSDVPFDVIRGCYVQVDSAAQENQEVIVTIDRAPNWFSDGNMRSYSSRRNLSR